MSNRRLKPEHIVLSIFSLNPLYRESISNGTLSENYLISKLCSASYPTSVPYKAGIRPNSFHGDSIALTETIIGLMSRGIINVPSRNAIGWVFPISPERYYEEVVLPQITKAQRKSLEEFAKNFN